MNQTKKALAVTVAVVLVLSSGLAAGAFQSFTAERSASIDVVTDNNGIVQLAAGPSSVVQQDADGAVAINTALGGSSGVNVDSVLEVGDDAAPSTTPAFSLTNAAGSAKDITLSYALTGTDVGSSDNVQFTVYDSSGTEVGTFAEGGSFTQNVNSGATYYVTVDIDTNNGNAGTDDLSGTLTVSAV